MLSAAEIKLGKPLAAKEPMPLATLLLATADYVGKTVQREGQDRRSLPDDGLLDGSDQRRRPEARIKVNDGEIEFPKDGAGKMAVAEGKLTKSELSKSRPSNAPRKRRKIRANRSIPLPSKDRRPSTRFRAPARSS